MRVLILTRSYLPTIGGLEIRVAQVAELLSQLGVEVVIATRTAGSPQERPFRVLRNPGLLETLLEVRAADAVYQPNLSLRELWPMAFVRKPWVVSHHSWYTRTDGSITLPDRLKRALSRRADVSMAVSRALARDLGPETIVAPTPYRDKIFFPRPEIARDRDLVFVGRLVSDKGVDVLVDALAKLAGRGLRPGLTIIGSGPESERIQTAVDAAGLGAQVTFDGMLQDEALARELARHQVLLVPSRYREPFGIVVLEGLASGCVVIGSEGGGLPDAIGPGGLLFPNGDAGALADRIEQVLSSEDLRRRLRAGAAEHLRAFSGAVVSQAYLELFRRLTSDKA